MTQVYIHIQKTSALPVQVGTYDIQLARDQLASLKAAHQSADLATLPVFTAPQATAPVDRFNQFIAATFGEHAARKVGYAELVSSDNTRINDHNSAKELDKTKQALAPLRTWLTALDLKKAVRRSEPTDTCVGLE